MGGFFSKTRKQESIFSVLRKLTNTIRDLETKEKRLHEIDLPQLVKRMHDLKEERRQKNAMQVFALYKKKEQTRDLWFTLRLNLETIKHEIETQQTNIVATNGFNEANEVMERALTMTSLRDVDKILDKCREHMEKGAEVFDALTSPINDLQGDEEELELEMAELMAKGITEKHKVELPELPEQEIAEGSPEEASVKMVPSKWNKNKKKGDPLKKPLLLVE